MNTETKRWNPISQQIEEIEHPLAAGVPAVTLPWPTKTIACGACGRELQVNERVCFAYCSECSERGGKKH
jgi:uncharacterized CHY-type Zn-finger protein